MEEEMLHNAKDNNLGISLAPSLCNHQLMEWN